MLVVFCTYSLAVYFGTKLTLEEKHTYSGGQVMNVIIAVLTASMWATFCFLIMLLKLLLVIIIPISPINKILFYFFCWNYTSAHAQKYMNLCMDVCISFLPYMFIHFLPSTIIWMLQVPRAGISLPQCICCWTSCSL